MSQIPPPLPPNSTPIPPSGLSPQMPLDDSGDLKNWPKVVGIISIVWGSIGVICGACQTISTLGSGAMQNMAGSMNPQIAQQMQNAPKPTIADIVIALLGFFASIVLVFAGSILVARRPQARAVHLLWAGGDFVLAIVGLIVGAGKIPAQMQQMQAQRSAAGGAAPPPGMEMFAYGFFACIAVIILAYPVFCLIWFGLIKRDTREITQGIQEQIA